LDLRFSRYTLVKSKCSVTGDLSFIVPAWAMYAIECGNYETLSEEEIESLNDFLDDLVKTYGNAVLAFGDESYFSTINDIDNLGGDVFQASLVPSVVNTYIVDLNNDKLIMKHEFKSNYVFFKDIIFEMNSIFSLKEDDYNSLREIINEWVEDRFNIPRSLSTFHTFSKINYRNDLISCIMRKAVETKKLDYLNNKKNNVSENSSSRFAGEYNGPIELGLRKWKNPELKPFSEISSHLANNDSKSKTLKDNIKRIVGMWEKGSDGTYDIPTHDVDTINEDLAVWFGKKKKPKGSKQPQGPWVNICKKDKNGKHPPCGRGEAKTSAYPKCRGYAAARRMSDEAKRKACSQKRRAEKKEPKTGKGNKPTMVSHKKKVKIKESDLYNIIKRVLLEQEEEKRTVTFPAGAFKSFITSSNEKFVKILNNKYDRVIVSGDLDLDETDIKILPNNLEVKGILFLRGSLIKELPENLKVNGQIDLRSTNIKSLPNNLVHEKGFIWILDTPLNYNEELINHYVDKNYGFYRY